MHDYEQHLSDLLNEHQEFLDRALVAAGIPLDETRDFHEDYQLLIDAIHARRSPQPEPAATARLTGGCHETV